MKNQNSIAFFIEGKSTRKDMAPESQAAFRNGPRVCQSSLYWFAGQVFKAGIVVFAAFLALNLAFLLFLYYQGQRRPKGKGQYVALGSSFAAGPGVGKRDGDSPPLCMGSDSNYAHLVARE